MILVVAPKIAQVRHHVAREALGVFTGQFIAHAADLAQQHGIADTHVGEGLAQGVPHGGGAPGYHVAVLQEVLPSQLLPGGRGDASHLWGEARTHGGCGAVTRRVGETRMHVQAAVEEIIDVRRVQPFRFLIAFGHANDLCVPGAVRVVVLAEFRRTLPVAVHHLLRPLVAVVAQVGVVVIVLQAEVPGLDAAAARDPYGRVRLLQRTRPDVHVAQLGVLAVEAEGFGAGPRLHDQAVRLVVLVA